MKNSELTGLYNPDFEKGSCGFGLMAHMDGAASHWLVETAIHALDRMTHRGAVAADGKTGDGCGLLMKKPDGFFRMIAREKSFDLAQNYAVGMVFLNQDSLLRDNARQAIGAALESEGLSVAGWRVVPTDNEACGIEALASLPIIEQVFVNAPSDMEGGLIEKHLFVARRKAEKAISTTDDTFYIPSLSSQVISYKGLVMPKNLPVFYQDLQDKRLASTLCVFHQRFSTNTWPQWRLAQPFRYLAHNGEINTIQGNRNWALARSHKFESPHIPDMAAVQPWVTTDGSDSCSMDNMLEGLLAGGVDLFRAMRLLVPAAWQNVDTMDPDLRAFYEYNSMHMEPWDGPAGVVMTDGRYAACSLDRNGLRPARYVITKDTQSGAEVGVGTYSGCVITIASEVGVFDYKPEQVVAKGRLKPGQMMASDTFTGELLLPEDIDQIIKTRYPYRKWMQKKARHLVSRLSDDYLSIKPMDPKQLLVYQKLFQVTNEERDQVIRVLAEAGQEAIGSMGDDTPQPVLSKQVRSLFDYFRQQFAQVTNPPIDPLREQIVMSLETSFGKEQNIFSENESFAERLIVSSPVLSEGKFKQLLMEDGEGYRAEVIDLNYDPTAGLESAIKNICGKAVAAVRSGHLFIVLSDRNIEKGKLPIHALLATGAVHHKLIEKGLRCDANIVVETATTRDSHHFATLIGYGASAVYPYLAYETLYQMLQKGEIDERHQDHLSQAYRKGINKGLYKIISKMGISTITSYRGAQLFEIVGLDKNITEMCFKGTTCRIEGATFNDLENDQFKLAKLAWDLRKDINQGGLLKYIHNEEYHAYNPDVIGSLQAAVRSGEYSQYQVFADHVNHRPIATLRDMLAFRDGLTAVELDDVEAIEDILPRFDSAGMSLGALSPEAHEALAIAMNRLGGRSNSGEGGEDPVRYGTEKMSKIKQVASGRFGVTPAYLASAEILQIKVAQGAKPGEGGQLPGDKVNKMIATLRYSKAGVALISPPPHHDIYSIEDLAQLIFDLKQVNPKALVSVKLVSEAGVGTIAAGVAKAYADLITIAGHDGGTAASPLTSVRYAGSPWELGLTETHQILRANNLRGRVRLQTDGGLKTGLDVVKAAILGAESFGFGTAPMVALGCKYLRICHLNNCATGVATQNNVLRLNHFIGMPEMVMNYFRFVAIETRIWMAKLGVTRMADLIGRTDLLSSLPGETAKQKRLDLTPILSDAGVPKDRPQYCTQDKNSPFDEGVLAEQMVEDAAHIVANKTGGVLSYQLRNLNRSIGARLSGEIAKRHGNQGMEEAPLVLNCHGTAGQSFGVWNAGGLHLNLEGDANDYVGKGMAGGKISIYPAKSSQFESQNTTIIGNTCLYGATGGRLFASGLAGERFAVRNSGACAVVEGIGDHGCEYMTGGVVVVLGQTGLNFGAGMTGGIAFVLDQENTFVDCYNHELIDIHRITNESHNAHLGYLQMLIEKFVEETGSEWGQKILTDLSYYAGRFWMVKPKAADVKSLLDTLRLAA